MPRGSTILRSIATCMPRPTLLAHHPSDTRTSLRDDRVEARGLSMTLAVRLTFGFGLAAVLAYLATPYAIALADRLQFYDKPAGYKGHLRPTPYLGGAAVMA